jgi:F-type H+-transporting ATPase subunit b
MGLGQGLPDWLKLLFQFINFAILAGALVYFLRKPYQDFLRKRHFVIKERIEEAEQLIRKAAEAKANYEGRLFKLDAEMKDFREDVIKEVEREKNRILEEARALADRIREQAGLAYDQEMKEATAKIRAEITEQTIRAAEEKVSRVFGREDHDRMVEEFISKIRSTN